MSREMSAKVLLGGSHITTSNDPMKRVIPKHPVSRSECVYIHALCTAVSVCLCNGQLLRDDVSECAMPPLAYLLFPISCSSERDVAFLSMYKEVITANGCQTYVCAITLAIYMAGVAKEHSVSAVRSSEASAHEG
jgi:hypothetical protein